jgi:protein-disulfide isomerase
MKHVHTPDTMIYLYYSEKDAKKNGFTVYSAKENGQKRMLEFTRIYYEPKDDWKDLEVWRGKKDLLTHEGKGTLKNRTPSPVKKSIKTNIPKP